MIIKPKRSPSGTLGSVIEDSDDLMTFRNEYNIMNSDFLFADSLVLIEGYSDRLTFEKWFEMLYPNSLSVRFLVVGGENEINPALVLSLMLQLNQHFAIISVVDRDRIENKKDQILEDLRGRFPHIMDKFKEEELKEYIYVLGKSSIESYLENMPSVIAT